MIDDFQDIHTLLAEADSGDANARNDLGIAYLQGNGVNKDKKLAVHWWHLAAGQGFVPAQANLGLAYLHGTGTKNDKIEATRWLTMAAEHGHVESQSLLGHAYFHGDLGFRKDGPLGIGWLIVAENSGDKKSAKIMSALRSSRLKCPACGLRPIEFSTNFINENSVKHHCDCCGKYLKPNRIMLGIILVTFIFMVAVAVVVKFSFLDNASGVSTFSSLLAALATGLLGAGVAFYRGGYVLAADDKHLRRTEPLPCWSICNAVSFDVSEVSTSTKTEAQSTWTTEEGDFINLSSFLPLGGATEWTVDAILSAPGESAEVNLTIDTLKFIEIDTYQVAQWIKRTPIPDQPHRYFFEGFIFIPFREVVVVIKVICPEYGMTGTRETLVTLGVMGDDNEAEVLGSGDQNPYDESLDSQFPGHPLSRLRKRLESIILSINIDADLVKRCHLVELSRQE